ncbi:MAG: C-GCAxxG-C-C family protein [Spirochaetales bacterium]|nr:C-GCAxxG-C-C family protein [Spirochaetales bacterium]
MTQQKLSLTEIIISGLDSKEDLNCAETILKASNIAYNMKLDKTSLKLAAGFGGGMGAGSTCGALTGAIMVLSHLFVKEKGHESPYIRELCEEMVSFFEDKMGDLACSNIREKYQDPVTGCRPIVLEAGIILQGIIERELKK